MSRVPRVQEYLKTSFTAEALSAARYRAYAERARKEGMPNLAQAWLDLAAEKDQLAIRQLETAGQVRGEDLDVKHALSEDHYENDVLYPKIIRQLEGADADAFHQVVAEQQNHVERLTNLCQKLQAATGDIDG